MGKPCSKPSTLKGVVHTADNKKILGLASSSFGVKNVNQIYKKRVRETKEVAQGTKENPLIPGSKKIKEVD